MNNIIVACFFDSQCPNNRTVTAYCYKYISLMTDIGYRWRCDVAVTSLGVSVRLLYIGPG